MAGAVHTCNPFPASMVEFSSSFHQPAPPTISPEFTANLVQHKWNENISHITTGFITNSPSHLLVRVDEAWEGYLGSSLFDYSNVTAVGLVANTLTTYTPGKARPDVWTGYVNPGFPLFPADVLIQAGAVVTGSTSRLFVDGSVASWSFMYQNAIPVTAYLDTCNVLVGYDFWVSGQDNERTRVVNNFFNIKVKK